MKVCIFERFFKLYRYIDVCYNDYSINKTKEDSEIDKGTIRSLYHELITPPNTSQEEHERKIKEGLVKLELEYKLLKES